VDQTTPCNAAGTAFFSPNLNDVYAGIGGQWVVFVDGGNDNCTANNGESLWAYNLLGGNSFSAFVKLADTTTLVPPDNVYTFVDFQQDEVLGNTLQVRDGTVLFVGYDSESSGCTGLYSMPVTGGNITRVVDCNSSLPGYGGNFSLISNSGSWGDTGEFGMSLDHGTIVFSAQTVGGANYGFWSAPVGVNTTKSQLKRIADNDTTFVSKYPPNCTTNCLSIHGWGSTAFIRGSTTVFPGDGGYSGINAIFVNSIADPILQSVQALPGDESHESNSYPYSYAEYYGPIVDGADIYFYGTDPDYDGNCAGTAPNGTFAGVFEIGTSGGTVTSIMNTCDPQPNGDAVSADSFVEFAANEGTTVFEVNDPKFSDPGVLDFSYNGVVSKLIQPGDPLPTGASCDGVAGQPGCVTAVYNIGTGAMDGGRVVFGAEGGPYEYDNGIYVASLACASTASDVSVTLGKLSYDSKTGIWSQSATVKNTGKTAITGPLSLVLANLSSDATLTDGSGSTVCFAPVGSPYIDVPLSGNQLAAKAGKAVTLDFAAPSTATITFTSEVAGVGAR
jgi:hypothetical protein